MGKADFGERISFTSDKNLKRYKQSSVAQNQNLSPPNWLCAWTPRGYLAQPVAGG